jgi:hypothetical protein
MFWISDSMRKRLSDFFEKHELVFWALNLALVAIASWAIFNLVNIWV